MNDTPHFLRLARALALGAAAVASVVACTNNSATDSTTPATTTTTASAGNEQPPPVEADASTAVASAEPTATPSNGEPCAQVGEHRVGDNPSSPARLSCTCHAEDGGAAQWNCAEMPMRIMGPAAPPELAA